MADSKKRWEKGEDLRKEGLMQEELRKDLSGKRKWSAQLKLRKKTIEGGGQASIIWERTMGGSGYFFKRGGKR